MLRLQGWVLLSRGCARGAAMWCRHFWEPHGPLRRGPVHASAAWDVHHHWQRQATGMPDRDPCASQWQRRVHTVCARNVRERDWRRRVYALRPGPLVFRRYADPVQ